MVVLIRRSMTVTDAAKYEAHTYIELIFIHFSFTRSLYLVINDFFFIQDLTLSCFRHSIYGTLLVIFLLRVGGRRGERKRGINRNTYLTWGCDCLESR